VIVSVAMRGGNASSPSPARTTALTGVAATKALLDGLPQRGNVLGSRNAPRFELESRPDVARWLLKLRYDLENARSAEEMRRIRGSLNQVLPPGLHE